MIIQYVEKEKGVDTFFIFMAQLLNSLGFPDTEDMYFCLFSWQSQRSDVDNGFLKLKAFFSLTLRKILVSLINSKENERAGENLKFDPISNCSLNSIMFCVYVQDNFKIKLCATYKTTNQKRVSV